MGDINPASLDNKQFSPSREETKTALGLQQSLSNEPYWRFESTRGHDAYEDFPISLTGIKIIHDYPILGIGPDTLGMIIPSIPLKGVQGKR